MILVQAPAQHESLVYPGASQLLEASVQAAESRLVQDTGSAEEETSPLDQRSVPVLGPEALIAVL